MASLQLRGLTVSIAGVEVLTDLDLWVDSGTTLAVLGRSGAGKSTLLRATVGLLLPSRGAVIVDGVDVTTVAAGQRGIVMVPQQPSLLPNLSLSDNVQRPLDLAATEAPSDRRSRAGRELRRFGIGRLADRRPQETSAGEQSLAATGRATVRQAPVLLLDESVSALDPANRRAAIRQLRDQQRELGSTMVVATNDWEVAAGLGDRVAVLTNGLIGQQDHPADLYNRPVSIDVGELSGRWGLNRLSGRPRIIDGERNEIITPAGVTRTWRPMADQAVILGIRPEDLLVDDDGELAATVVNGSVLGRTSLLDLDAGGIPLKATGPVPVPDVGSTVRLSWTRAHLFDLNGEAIDHLDRP